MSDCVAWCASWVRHACDACYCDDGDDDDAVSLTETGRGEKSVDRRRPWTFEFCSRYREKELATRKNAVMQHHLEIST